MDRTTQRGYSYPQCAPPLVKDASNAPVQTRLLAEDIDSDLDTVSGLIQDTYQLPTAILRITSATSIASGDAVPFDVVEYDPEGWATTLPGITLPGAGAYLVTASVHSVVATNVQSLAVQFTRDGGGFYLQGTSPPVTSFGRMTASGVTVPTGGTIGVKIFYSGTDPSNFDNCWLTVTRMVAF